MIVKLFDLVLYERRPLSLNTKKKLHNPSQMRTSSHVCKARDNGASWTWREKEHAPNENCKPVKAQVKTLQTNPWDMFGPQRNKPIILLGLFWYFKLNEDIEFFKKDYFHKINLWEFLLLISKWRVEMIYKGSKLKSTTLLTQI